MSFEIMRHSLEHVMVLAIRRLYGDDIRLGVGPVIQNGFYQDIDHSFSPNDFEKIEAEMRKIIDEDLPFIYEKIRIDDAISLFESKQQPFKVELLKDIRDKGSSRLGNNEENADVAQDIADGYVSFYTIGSHKDLCRGPHVSSSKILSSIAFKLDRIAGSYWRGNEKNPMLTRIYGLAFENHENLNDFLEKREEAKRRDHRKLGQELQLFLFSEDVGPGLPLWLPNGTILREELERLAKDEERREGFLRVSTPNIAKEQLFYRSGHLPYYKDDMYPPLEAEGDKYMLKPMSCPHHHMMYLSQPRSYRDLPIRYAEYGQVYRYESSGSLSGIMRTRGFCQNDGHRYCRYDQAKDEFLKVMQSHARLYKVFDIEKYYMRLSKPDLNKLDKYVDRPDQWIASVNIVREAMEESGLPFIEAEGEAAFYGPKIDFMIENVIGTEYAISTNQLDFLASERLGLVYIGPDNAEYPVYVIHQAPLGAHERFVAFLIEHYGGAFPTWLAPVQAMVIPIADKHAAYAEEVRDLLFNSDVPSALGGIRVEVDASKESMQKKIRNAQMRKIPYMLVVGDREVSDKSVSVRLRNGADLKSMPIDNLIKRIRQEVKRRKDS